MSGQRWHTAYTEPHSIHGTWTSPPTCHATEEEARAHIAAVTALAGPDAAKRRTWSVTPCDGRSADDRFTSWGREADDRWNAFRDAVGRGIDPERAARAAGLVDEEGRRT